MAEIAALVAAGAHHVAALFQARKAGEQIGAGQPEAARELVALDPSETVRANLQCDTLVALCVGGGQGVAMVLER